MSSGLWVVARREFVAAWVKGVVCLAIAAATAVILPPTFDWMANSTVPALPAGMDKVLAAQMNDYNLYLWANWYGKNLLQFILIFALIFGAPLLAGEAASGSMGFTLTRPLSRRQVLGGKFLAGAVWLSLIAVLSTLALLLVSAWAGRPVSWALMLCGLPGTLAGTLLAYAVAVVFSALVDDIVKAGLYAAGVLALLAWPSLVPAAPALARYSFVSYMAAAGPRTPPAWVWWGTAAVCLGVVVLYLLARRLFLRRDY